MKKIIITLLSIVMAMAMVLVPVVATSAGGAAASEEVGVSGGEVTVTVSVHNLPEVQGMAVSFEVPKGLTVVEDNTKTKWLPEGGVGQVDYNKSTGALLFANPADMTASTEVFQITFSINSPTDGKLIKNFAVDFTVMASDSHGKKTAVETTASITVVAPAASVKLNKTSAALDLAGQRNVALSATVGPAYTTDVLSWQSSDETVATVDDNGNVTAVGLGTVDIIAKAGDVTAVCKITVSCSHQNCLESTKKDPSCTEGGYTTYSCSACELVYAADHTAALGHDYKAVVTAPDCTNPGYTTYTCAACDNSYVGDHTNALGHDYKAAVTDPTCTAGGYTTYTCATCGNGYVDDHTDAKGHSYVSRVTAPTCTAGGYTTYTCADCSNSYVGDEVNAKGHSYVGDVIEPDCTNPGYTTYTCSECQNSYVGDHVNAKGHSYVGDVTKPTCTEGGYTDFTCSVCQDKYTGDRVAAKGHTGAKPVKENFRTTEEGSFYDSVVYCSVCEVEVSRTAVPCATLSFGEVGAEPGDVVYVDVSISPLEYASYRLNVNFGKGLQLVEIESGNADIEFETEETENGVIISLKALDVDFDGVIFRLYFQVAEDAEAGAHEINCDVKGVYTETSGEVAIAVVEGVVNVHKPVYDTVVTAPTCTKGGYTTYTCTICGKSHVADETPATGHKESTAVQENHRYIDGVYCCEAVVYCVDCGFEMSRTPIELYLVGDVNGDGEVDTKDANLVCSYYNELLEIGDLQQLIADVNGDGEVDTKDANLICSFYNELIDSFPVCK